MRIPTEITRSVVEEVVRREDDEKDEGKKNKTLIVIAITVVSIFAIIIITWLVTVKVRRSRKGTKKAKADKLPGIFSWIRLPWMKRGKYSNALQDNNEMDRNSTTSRSREMTGSSDPERQNMNTTAAGVDRNTSVRSVMTLPAYSPAVRENERVLGREGERGGIDTVLEFPETQDDEEQRRDGEMESLYQIRLARRREAREREERRQARRDARARGDTAALAEIRAQAEAAAEASVSQMLIAEHQGANRERRVSSVQYRDLGVARHDGTRLRANSSESDVRPLLDSAASISGQSGRSGAPSTNTLHTHYRGPSVSSVLSVDSRLSDEFEFPDAHHSRSRSIDRTRTNSDDFEIVELTHPRSRSISRAPTPSIDIPREEAPAYEDPPNYESPVNTRAPQLPSLERLPSIQVTTEPTPVDGRRPSR